PEGSIGLNRPVLVDPNRSTFELAGDRLGLIEIATPNRPAEPHRAVVGFRDDFRDVMVADDRQRGTKLLVVDESAAMIDVGDKGHGVEKARSSVGIPAQQYSSTFGAGFLNVRGTMSNCIRFCTGPS